jgi:hypothetical protein
MRPTVNANDRRNLARAVVLLNSGKRKLVQILETILLLNVDGPGAAPLNAREKRALKAMQRRKINPLREVSGKHSVSRRILRAYLLHVVNSVLEKCPCVPMFGDWRPSRVRWVPDSRLNETQGRMASAIQVFISLAERGLLYRLQLCDRNSCGRWFQGPEKKKFHSTSCCERDFVESEHGIQWRQKYQREYMAKMRRNARKENKEFFETEQARRSKGAR